MKFSQNLFILFFLLVAVSLLNLLSGSVSIHISEVWNAISSYNAEESKHFILLEYRLPKAITAIAAGGALSVCGLILQAFFRNPLAGPYILGISSGASLGVALVTLASGMSLWGLAAYLFKSGFSIAIAGFVGASTMMIILLVAAYRLKSSITLLILGLLLGSAISAIIGILEFFTDSDSLKNYVLWTMGSVARLERIEALALLLFISSIAVFTLSLAKHLDALLLGENYAQSMGLNTARFRNKIVWISGLLAGTVTALCGPIAFIGIAVPHMVRFLFKEQKHLYLIPYCFLTGSLLLLFCDWIAGLPFSDQVLPINSITSLIGLPIVIRIILKPKIPSYN
ncbi:MAG: iron ABC transporter permease [Cyclobacteriaceae bacterium]|nr:iron ABC transporter permease [Cyclobacteriaceae bacterium]MCH8516883.1 iron ABC transporter permease [Cyclobacteriaceae bacterium]